MKLTRVTGESIDDPEWKVIFDCLLDDNGKFLGPKIMFGYDRMVVNGGQEHFAFLMIGANGDVTSLSAKEKTHSWIELSGVIGKAEKFMYAIDDQYEFEIVSVETLVEAKP